MNKVYMIGNAHLDPVWLWRWQEGYSEVMATFRSALDRIKEFDEFVFTCAGAAYYEWVEQTDPAMFAEISRRIAEGRWVLAGGWWIQPDCNLPCGESFARHSLYSQRYFQKKFGKIATFGYNVDSFGHSAMLPQILKLSGMDGYVYQRPGTHEKNYDFEGQYFLWTSPDGTQLPTYRLEGTYLSGAGKYLIEKAQKHLDYADKEGQPAMCFFGVGNHGGGATIEQLYDIRSLKQGAQGERYEIASPRKAFDEMDRSKLPVLHGDLQHHAVGCYTTAMPMKQLNHLTEARLISAEAFSSAAALRQLGEPAQLKEAWKQVLFHHFHDIMGGCCVKEGIEDAMHALGFAKTLAEQAQNLAQQKIAWNIDTSKGIITHLDRHDGRVREQDGLGTPLILFNPHSYPVSLPVNLMYEYPLVTEDDGTPVPSQAIRGGVTNGDQNKYESTIIARLPALGWKLYWGYTKKQPAPPTENSLSFADGVLQNDWLSVKFSRGAIASIIDRTDGKELLSAPMTLEVLDDTAHDTWAHSVDRFDKKIGEVDFAAGGCRLLENGSVCTTVRCLGSYGNSSVQLDFTLYRELRGLFVKCKINWQEKFRILKWRIPTAFSENNICGIPFGALTRENTGTEDPMLSFVAAKEKNDGLFIATDSRTAYDCTQGALGVTLLRSPLYTDHYGVRDDRCESFMAQGEQEFTACIDRWQTAGKAQRTSDCLVSPPNTILGTFHKGKLPAEAGNLLISAENIVAEALKVAEDGDGSILRLRETDGAAAKVTVTLPATGQSFSAELTPWEIKSFRIPPLDSQSAEAPRAVTEVDFLERSLT